MNSNAKSNQMKYMIKIFFASLLLMLTSIDKASSQSKKKIDQFKLLRGNGTKFTSQKIERNEDVEYPGHDEKLVRILKQKWNDYYACLESKQKEIKKPELRRLIEGQNTVFECNICVRPFQNYEELEWRYKPLSPSANITELELLDLTPEMELLSNKTLKIFNVVQYFEGLYVCFHGRDPVSAFILEISPNDTIERVVSAYEIRKSSLSLNGTELNLHYQWGTWSECSTCGTIGRKYRYGTCFVSPKNAEISAEMRSHSSRSLHKRRLFNLAQKTKNITRKITDIYYKITNSTSESEKSSGWEVDIIKKFSNGVPCASSYLPQAAFEQIKNFKSAKVIIKFCQESCQEGEIFEVEDRFGKIIEVANNSAGIYSIHQTLPQLPPSIERVSVTGELGKDIIIQCPGTSLTNTPVTWAVNKKIIFPEVIANQSKGRFEIDLVNRISLKKLRLKDSHTYRQVIQRVANSGKTNTFRNHQLTPMNVDKLLNIEQKVCWQKGRLVGTVHLEVEKKFRVGFNHHITLLGVAAVIGTFLFVGAKIVTRKLNSKKK